MNPEAFGGFGKIDLNEKYKTDKYPTPQAAANALGIYTFGRAMMAWDQTMPGQTPNYQQINTASLEDLAAYIAKGDGVLRANAHPAKSSEDSSWREETTGGIKHFNYRNGMEVWHMVDSQKPALIDHPGTIVFNVDFQERIVGLDIPQSSLPANLTEEMKESLQTKLVIVAIYSNRLPQVNFAASNNKFGGMFGIHALTNNDHQLYESLHIPTVINGSETGEPKNINFASGKSVRTSFDILEVPTTETPDGTSVVISPNGTKPTILLFKGTKS